MYRITTDTKAPNLFGPGKDGFRDGDTLAGVASTELNAAWFNGFQEELLGVIESAGFSADPASHTQLRQAIQAMLGAATPTASAVVKGLLKLATAALAQGWADDTVALTPWSLGQSFKGANQSLAAAGFQRLPGGLIMQWGTATLNGGTSVTFPFAFPNRCVSVAVGRTASVSGLAEYAQVTAIGVSGFTAVGLEGNGAWVSSTFALDWFAVGY